MASTYLHAEYISASMLIFAYLYGHTIDTGQMNCS